MRFSGLYIGRVVQNEDPMKLGRVRVRVPHVYGSPDAGEGIADEALPWAIPTGLPNGASKASGGVAWVPNPGDQVACMFLDGSPEQPVYMHCMATTDHARINEVYRYNNGKPVAEKLTTAYGHTDTTNAARRQIETKGESGVAFVDKKDPSSPDANNTSETNAIPPGETAPKLTKVSVFGYEAAGAYANGNPIVKADPTDNQRFFDGTTHHPPTYDANGNKTSSGSVGAAVNPSVLYPMLKAKYPDARIATSYADYASFASSKDGARYRQLYKQVRVTVVTTEADGTQKKSPPIQLRDMGPADAHSDRVDLTLGAYDLVAQSTGSSRTANGINLGRSEKKLSAELHLGEPTPDTSASACHTKPDSATPAIGDTPTGTGADGSQEQSTDDSQYKPKAVFYNKRNSFTLSDQNDGTAIGQTFKSKCDYAPHYWVVGQRVEIVAGDKDNKIDADDDLKDTYYGHLNDETLAKDSFFGLTSKKRMKLWAKVAFEMVSNQQLGLAAGTTLDIEARETAMLSSPSFTLQGYARTGGSTTGNVIGTATGTGTASTGKRTDSTAGAVGSQAASTESYADTYSMFVNEARWRLKTSWIVDGYELDATFDLNTHATKAQKTITRDAKESITDAATSNWTASAQKMAIGKATQSDGTSVDAETLDVNTTQTIKVGSVSIQVTGDTECVVTVGGASVKVTTDSCLTTVGGISMNLTSAGVAITGDVSVTGGITTTGSVAALGDVTAAGTSLSSHTHGGVQSGTSTTLPPTGSAAASTASVGSTIAGIFGF